MSKQTLISDKMDRLNSKEENQSLIVKFFNGILMLSFFLLVAGCTTIPLSKSKAKITFDHLEPYSILVSDIEIISLYSDSLDGLRVTQTIDQSPKSLLELWANERLIASGKKNIGRFIILDASISERSLPIDGSLDAIFINEQSSEYISRVEALFEIRNSFGSLLANASAQIIRKISVPEGSSLRNREDIIFNLIEAAMKDFDSEISSNIESFLKEWIIF